MATTEPTFRLVYASRMNGACLSNLDRELPAILDIAVPNNRRLCVTGILIAHRGWFLQALEGDQAVVRELYQKISADPRHRNVVVVGEGRPGARSFGRWTMCALSLSGADAAVLGVLDRKASFDPSAFPERTVMKLLQAVAAVHAQSFTEQQASTMFVAA